MTTDTEKLARMLVPVVCSHYGAVYDLCSTHPTARYSDCTCYITPCCGRHADDRRWKSLPDFTELSEIVRRKGIFGGLSLDGICHQVRVVGGKDDEHNQDAGPDHRDSEQAG